MRCQTTEAYLRLAVFLLFDRAELLDPRRKESAFDSFLDLYLVLLVCALG